MVQIQEKKWECAQWEPSRLFCKSFAWKLGVGNCIHLSFRLSDAGFREGEEKKHFSPTCPSHPPSHPPPPIYIDYYTVPIVVFSLQGRIKATIWNEAAFQYAAIFKLGKVLIWEYSPTHHDLTYLYLWKMDHIYSCV